METQQDKINRVLKDDVHIEVKKEGTSHRCLLIQKEHYGILTSTWLSHFSLARPSYDLQLVLTTFSSSSWYLSS